MKLKNLLAGVALAALAPVAANATHVVAVDMNFQSGATFTGDVTFADDYSSYSAVNGTLSGGGYGTQAITWVWSLGTNYSSGAGNFSSFLMNGTDYSNYSVWIQFAYNYSAAPVLTFTSGVSYFGADNYINYVDPMVSGSIGAVPEPSTWALMLAGLGALGFAGYRRARAVAA